MINVLPNDRFTQDNVKQFILNIESQHQSNVTLIFKRDPSLNTAIISYLKHSNVNTLMVNKYSDVTLNIHQQVYWINLHVTDCLLPHAIVQWEQIIQRHSSNVIELSFLRNELPLTKQTEQIIQQIDQHHSVRLNTVKAVLHLPLNVPLFNLSLSSQLLILFGLQNYKVMDTLDRYDELSNPYLGNNFLIHCTPDLIKHFKFGLVNTLVKVIIDQPEIVRINLPTVILSQYSLKNRVNWLEKMGESANYIGDANILSQYRKFVNSQVTQVKKLIFHSSTSRFVKHHLMAKVRHINKALLQVK